MIRWAVVMHAETDVNVTCIFEIANGHGHAPHEVDGFCPSGEKN